MLHFVIVNIEIAAQKNLANEHPLFRPIQLVSELAVGEYGWMEEYTRTESVSCMLLLLSCIFRLQL